MKSGLHNSIRHNSVNVGAGLLANTLGQLTHSSTDRPPSRASPLPHLTEVTGFFSGHKKRLPFGSLVCSSDGLTCSGKSARLRLPA
ncbi:hypothetical protein C9382_02470 [Pseudomonas aylmerensis]|uniref:Uncharacterized protein n=1 Tax=Pseudomonas aylmerensis TaxID=1869229 RepID=A0A2T4GA33_9PSED|nr:hypothetical protein C9382_02470 [Pseudomonas aylmerensis]